MIEIDRDQVIQSAHQKYILSGVTKNITEALEMYLKNDASEEEKIPLFISTPEVHQVKKMLEYVRPHCDDCDSELFMQTNAVDMHGIKHPTSWNCNKCGRIEYSEKTLSEWMEILQSESGQ
jgi:hypothetical protein